MHKPGGGGGLDARETWDVEGPGHDARELVVVQAACVEPRHLQSCSLPSSTATYHRPPVLISRVSSFVV